MTILNKIDFADNLGFKTRNGLKLIQQTLRILNKIVLRPPAHLAHAIAAQTRRTAKAMARAKSTRT